MNMTQIQHLFGQPVEETPPLPLLSDLMRRGVVKTWANKNGYFFGTVRGGKAEACALGAAMVEYYGRMPVAGEDRVFKHMFLMGIVTHPAFSEPCEIWRAVPWLNDNLLTRPQIADWLARQGY